MTLRLAIVVSLFVAGCSDDPVDSVAAPAVATAEPQTDGDPTDESAKLASTTVTAPPAGELVPEVSPGAKVVSPDEVEIEEASVLPTVAPIRLMVFSQAAPVVCDLVFLHGETSLDDVAIEAASALLDAISDEPDAPPTWDAVFGSPLLRLSGGMSDSPPTVRQRRLLMRTYDRNGNDTVEPAELFTYVNRGMPGIGWFVLRAQQAATGSRQSNTLAVLDFDQDGLLSVDEIQSANHRLQRFDADGDGVVWRGDLNPIESRVVVPNQRQLRSDEIPAVMIEDDSDWDDIYYRCQDQYGAGGPLELASLDSPAVWMPLDADSNGLVTRQEIESLASMDPHVVVESNFAADEARAALAANVAGETSTVSVNSPVSLALAVAGARIEVGLQLPSDNPQNADVLGRIDTNADKLISETEFRLLGLPVQFDRYDQDDSGSLDSTELGKLDDLVAAVPNMRVEFWLLDRDDAVFACLDANADDRLSRRELQSAEGVLQAADTNSDGRIDTYELGNAMQIVIKRGAGPFAPDLPTFPASSVSATDAPAWFLQTDANRDGEIDATEFLGGAEQFRHLDTNGDGYIQPSELD